MSVYVDNRDRLRNDVGFNLRPSPPNHMDNFTDEQQKKIRDNTPEWFLGKAIRDVQFSVAERLIMAFKQAWQVYWLVWKGTK